MHLVLAPATGSADAWVLQPADAAGAPTAPSAVVPGAEMADAVARAEQRPVRWVWDRTRETYGRLLASGISVERSHDLTLSREILRNSEFAAETPYIKELRSRRPEDEPDLAPRQLLPMAPAPDQGSLFEGLDGAETLDPRSRQQTRTVEELTEELQDQLAAVAGSSERRRLTLLLAAESSRRTGCRRNGARRHSLAPGPARGHAPGAARAAPA